MWLEHIKEVTAEIAAKTRILKNMKDPVTGGEPRAFADAYEECSGIRFGSQTPTSFCGIVIYKSTEEMHLVHAYQTASVPLLLQQISFAPATTRPQLKCTTPALYDYSEILADEHIGDV